MCSNFSRRTKAEEMQSVMSTWLQAWLMAMSYWQCNSIRPRAANERTCCRDNRPVNKDKQEGVSRDGLQCPPHSDASSWIMNAGRLLQSWSVTAWHWRRDASRDRNRRQKWRFFRYLATVFFVQIIPRNILICSYYSDIMLSTAIEQTLKLLKLRNNDC